MINRLKMNLMVPGLALALAAPAFAQDTTTTQDGTVTTMGETSTGGDAPGATADMSASASGGRYPVKYAARPLTLSRMTLVPGLNIKIAKFIDTGFGLELGAQFGITDDLEVGVVLAPLTLSPGTSYGDIPLYGRFRFVRGNFELGAQVAVFIPTSTDFGLAPALVSRLHAGNFRLDIDAGVRLTFSDPEMLKELQIPISASLNFSDNFYGAILTGVFLPEFDALRVPLGVGFGYTIAKGPVPMLDIGASFNFDNYLNTAGVDTLNFDVFTVLLTAKFYLFL